MRSLGSDWRESGILSALVRLAKASCASEWERLGWLVDGSVEEAVVRVGHVNGRKATTRDVALHRVEFGARLERFAVASCEKLCDNQKVCQLYFDSYAAACWTSAHAEFVASIDAGLAEPPTPSISSIPCASSALDLSELFDRRNASRDSRPKAAEPLTQLIGRCTNPGGRGWSTVLGEALEEKATNSVVRHAILVCLCGFHPQIHPQLRPNWKERMTFLRCCTVSANKESICASAVYVKEAIRRYLASVMAVSSATHAALSSMGHPVRHLHQPPFQFPHIGMESAMAAFLDAARAISVPGDRTPSLEHALKAAFDARTATTKATTQQLSDVTKRAKNLSYAHSWLGKGTANVHTKQSLVVLASDVWAACFKANFVAFWIFAQSHQLRVSRLDETQHRAIHGMNSATRLVAQLDNKTSLAIQRLALYHSTGGIMTIAEVAKLLRIKIAPSAIPSNGIKNISDATRLFSALGATSAAKLLCFARAAWVGEELLVVDLGPKTREMQIRALRQRLQIADDVPLHKFPLNSTSVCICTECRRVANAHAQVTNGIPVPFNEFGASSCQINWQSSNVQLHCAKRSSAALRTAVSFESDMKKRKIESEEVNQDAIDLLTAPRRATSVESGIGARVRRDAKNSLMQLPVALACGETPMVTINVVGRVVRVYKNWYALCSFCAALTKVLPQNRYAAEICCLRCDHKLLWRHRESMSNPQNASTSGAKQRLCRFCGVVDTSGNWRVVKAPHDIAGDNALLPPPLRTVVYCRSHYRAWVSNAHKLLQTRAVLAHIAHNAKPVFAVDTAEDADDAPAVSNSHSKKRKKRGLG